LADSRERLRRDRLDERAHLRRSLHDGVSPSFAGIAMTAATAQGRTDDPEARRLLARIEVEARAGTDTMRALLDGLRPPGLADAGLAGALESRAAELTDATGTTFEVMVGEPVSLDPEAERTAYLLAVEAMVNAARHARAQRCRVTLAADSGHLVVVVEDDGVGRGGAAEGDGLTSARERLASIGGELRIGDAHGGGTRVEARLPQWQAAG
jgi:signal transduction histidine kinase